MGHMTTTRRRRAVSGTEKDVHSSWRHVLVWCQHPGATAAVKRRTNRRERQEGRREVRDAVDIW